MTNFSQKCISGTRNSETHTDMEKAGANLLYDQHPLPYCTFQGPIPPVFSSAMYPLFVCTDCTVMT